jgi:hypothetical protein
VVPLHVAVPCVVSHTRLQPLQLDVVVVAVSQPLVSGAAVLQLANPALQLEYVQVVPLHAALLLLTVSHALPQPPQFVIVLVGVSHPFAFLPDVSQSAHPGAHAEYRHFPPGTDTSQNAPTL